MHNVRVAGDERSVVFGLLSSLSSLLSSRSFPQRHIKLCPFLSTARFRCPSFLLRYVSLFFQCLALFPFSILFLVRSSTFRYVSQAPSAPQRCGTVVRLAHFAHSKIEKEKWVEKAKLNVLTDTNTTIQHKNKRKIRRERRIVSSKRSSPFSRTQLTRFWQ